jgi:hypothetical protein
MDRAVLVDDLKGLYKALDQKFGPVVLAMLLFPDPGLEDLWNLIVSAESLDALGRAEAISAVVDLMSKNLKQETRRRIIRVTVLKRDDPFVKAMNSSYQAEDSVLNVNSAFVSGIEIPQAIVLQSKAAA